MIERFALADELTCYYDRPSEPANVHLEVRVPGRLDPAMIRAAASDVLASQPRILARRRPATWRRGYHWEFPAPPRADLVLTAGYASQEDLDRQRDEFLSRSPSLDLAPPLRFLHASGCGGDFLILNAHHAAFDGLACLRLLREVAAAYSARAGNPESAAAATAAAPAPAATAAAPAPAAPAATAAPAAPAAPAATAAPAANRTAMGHRVSSKNGDGPLVFYSGGAEAGAAAGAAGAGAAAGAAGAGAAAVAAGAGAAAGAAAAEAGRTSGRSGLTARIAAGPGGHPGRPGYGAHLVTWDGLAVTDHLRSAGLSVNDLLIAALMVTISDWNQTHAGGRGQVKITMPVGDKAQAGSAGQWANRSRLTTIAARVPPGARPADLIADVARQTRAAKQQQGAQLDIGSRALAAAPLPVAVKHMLLRSALRFAGRLLCDTSLVSNLGVVNTLAFGGRPATQAWFSTSAHMPRGLSAGAVTAGGALRLTFRYRRALMSSADAAEFAGMYVKVLDQFAGQEAVRG